ncbi:MAG TPA: family 20 glycosylhydrolase [Thermoguttaceae bacterium]|nr:family 20 glycosylhydrolase [Thermoguttaceae bacterium]
MRSRTAAGIFLFVILANTPATHAAESRYARATRFPRVNLLQNADFREGRKHWTAQGDGENAINVSRAGLFFQRGEGFFRLYQDVDVVGPGVWLLTIRVLNQEGTSGGGALVLTQAGGEWAKDAISLPAPAPHKSWQEAQKLIHLGADVTKVRVGLSGTPTGILFGSVSFARHFAREPLTIPLLRGQVTVDGSVTESAWRRAVRLADFRDLENVDRACEPATHVNAFTDGRSLFLAFAAEEPAMDKIRTVQRHSPVVRSGDHVEAFISPNRKDSYQFLVNADGYRACIQRTAEKSPVHRTWYDDQGESGFDYLGNWEAAATKHADKYLVEMKIDLAGILGGQEGTNPRSLYLNLSRRRTTGEPEMSNWGGLPGLSFCRLQHLPELRIAWHGEAAGAEAAGREEPVLDRITQPLGMPRFLIAGKPLKGALHEGKTFPLPAELRFVDEGVSLSESLKEFVARGLTDRERETESPVSLSLWEGDECPLSLDERQRAICRSNEAFLLEIEPDGIRIAGRTREGVLRGVATACLLGSQAKSSQHKAIPCLTMVDAPRLALRGWDLSGGSDVGSARDMIDILFLLRMNYATLDLVGYGDDPRFPFDSHPNLGGKRYTKEDYRQLSQYAKERGINLIPQLYLWSRAGWILNKPEYEHMAAEKKHSYPMGRKFERSFNAFHPDASKLVFDLLDEVIETMEPTDVHLGMDELHFAKIVDPQDPHSQGKTELDWIFHTVGITREHLSRRGVRLWMWADEINPQHNAPRYGISELEQDGPKLAPLPRDIVLNPWHYGIPEAGRFRFVKFFADLGFTVVGAPAWYRAENVALFTRDVYHYGAAGLLGTTWGSPHPSAPYKQVMTGMSLAAYLTWSPENCCLEDFPFVNTLLYQQAAYHYGKEKPYVADAASLALADVLPEGEPSVASGDELVKAMGLPDRARPAFLEQEASNYRGAVLRPFRVEGRPAGLVIRGNAAKGPSLKIGKTARYVTLMHTTNKVSGYEGKGENDEHFRNAVPATYLFRYDDGTTEKLPLKFRTHVTDWNDFILGRLQEPAIFGSMLGRLQVNIPTFTWENPHPETTIESLEIQPGNREGMDVIVYAVSLDG